MTCGLAAPQMRTLYRFILPDKWNVALSQHEALYETASLYLHEVTKL
jgi:hypothetical protein